MTEDTLTSSMGTCDGTGTLGKSGGSTSNCKALDFKVFRNRRIPDLTIDLQIRSTDIKMSSLSRRACYKCGNVGHYAEVCSSSERLCYNCKQPGESDVKNAVRRTH
jgi:hypothetical protein